MFMYCSSTFSQKKFLGLPPFPDWGFIVSHCLGRKKTGVFQCRHILGIGGFKSIIGALGNLQGRTPDSLIILMASLSCWV